MSTEKTPYDILAAQIRSEVGCTCSYPNPTYRNMSGHSPSCPFHGAFMARVRDRLDAERSASDGC